MGTGCSKTSSTKDGGEQVAAASVPVPSPAAAAAAAAARAAPVEETFDTDVQVTKRGFSHVQHTEITRALAVAKSRFAENAGKVFKDVYKTHRMVGHGAFARVVVVSHRVTGEQYAAKILTKKTDDDGKQKSEVHKEIAIMTMLKEHPNSIQLHEVFEDDDTYYLVLELCSGGELFDAIIQKGHFSEKEAAEKMKCLVDFMAYAHSKGIVHRDLKPENILLSDNTKDAVLKVIDFGTSDFCGEGEKLTQKFGTPYYVAPEVLKKCYDRKVDVWSSGVILYILLCGYPPFGGKTDDIILQRVGQGYYTFEGKEWMLVSKEATDMIKRMLVMDVNERISAADLLKHPWFETSKTAPPSALGQHMVKRLKAFAGMSRLKRLALVVLARTLTDRDVKRLRELFQAMDKDGDGRINYQELHAALDKVGAAIGDEEVNELFNVCNVDGTGKIDYNEFIAAMLDTGRVGKRRDAVRKSFEELDADGDGQITAEDLNRATRGRVSVEDAREMLEEVGITGEDGNVDFKEFERMMQS